jgi:2-succinyl-5-enolpyruvyl-6-hydroxy-3-cyclohexene-1-carboxylate synthase
MPIRDADMFFFPKQQRLPIFANRGLSGIDGNIATICGIASKMPVTAVIGDQSALHDLNSIAQLKTTKYPVRLIIINNGGGGIFSFLPIGKRSDLLDAYFSAAHKLNFEQMVCGFGLNYQRVETLEQLIQSDATVIEVTTSRPENHLLHQQIDASIKAQLCNSFYVDF